MAVHSSADVEKNKKKQNTYQYITGVNRPQHSYLTSEHNKGEQPISSWNWSAQEEYRSTRGKDDA